MCVFCEIVQGHVPAHVVWEDEICMAFLDSDPISEGHVLLVPREHYLDADEIPKEMFLHMMCVSQKLTAAVKRAYSPDGYSIMQNGGAFNDIGHYHMHIFPRYSGDGFGWKNSDGEYCADDRIAEKIRGAL